MKHKIKILNIDVAYSQANNEHFLDVEVEVSKEDEIVGTKKFGYPIDSKEEFILADLSKVAETLDSDLEYAKKSAKLEASFENANELKKSLTGLIVDNKKNDE